MNTTNKKKIALFASGKGSNVFNIIEYFKNSEEIEVSLVLSNNPNAGALEYAKNYNIKTIIFNRVDLFETNNVLNILNEKDIDCIVLAGFLWKIPFNILSEYKDKILNIHPSLLPMYGGKGMYGDNIHKLVITNKDTETGITIHIVNEEYDKGRIILQEKINIEKNETLKTLKQKISLLEKESFPKTIEKYIKTEI